MHKTITALVPSHKSFKEFDPSFSVQLRARARQLDASCRRAPRLAEQKNLGANSSKNFCGQVLGEEWIGRKDSRSRIPTPALILDLEAMEYNIQRMAKITAEKKMALRPHCKSHKSVKIAKLQMKAGAIGISCATLGEAEVMARGKIPGVLITSPVVPADKITRLIALNEEAEGLLLVVDHLQNIEDLSRANGKKPLHVLIDFDIGQHRTGAKSVEEALALAEKITRCPTIKFAGMQAYGGHLQHIADYFTRQKQIRLQNKRIQELCGHLRKIFKEPFIVTGGGTGSCDIDLDEGVYTEIQVGSYLFMDVEYSEVALLQDGSCPYKPSLFVLSCVISTNDRFSVVDAGLKAFATDGPKPRVYSGAPKSAAYKFLGDEHGGVDLALPLGHLVEFLTPHCDPTINLYDFFHCVRGNVLEAIWPVEARGLH